MKRGLSLLLSTIVLLAMSGPAASHDQGYHPWDQGESWEWRLYHAVGFCGEVNSRYVKSVKAILWAAGYIQNMDYIDQSFTNGTDTNVRDYQSFHNLGVDGCVGWNSWSNMQHGGHSNLQSTWYHLQFVSSGCCGSTYQWKDQYGSSRRVRYYKDQTYGDGYDLCWSLTSAHNDSNGASRTYGHRIDHDGDAACD